MNRLATRSTSAFKLLAAAALVAGLAGCGSSSTSSTSSTTESSTAPSVTTTASASATTTAAAAPSGAAQVVKLAANPEGSLSYDTTTLTAHPGKVTIEFTNMAPLQHNVTVESSGSTLGATPTFSGATKSLTLDLKAGTYTFFCSVPGHRQGGMQGTLTVQ
ncbi:MAG: plastocyanin/azurin family copper-binding protein [Solirubrobacterales bacterium]